MTNRIRNIVVLDQRLDPVQTELRVEVEVDSLTPGVEIKGRLTGPRCKFAGTVEIAYPLREVGRSENPPRAAFRVVIPEPSLWEPVTPFLYEATVELWQDGRQLDRQRIAHGMRRVQLTPAGLKLNGKPFRMRGKEIDLSADEAQLHSLRSQGFDLVLASIDEVQPLATDLWRQADRCGLLVLATARSARSTHTLGKYASALGWTLPIAALDDAYAGADESNRPLFGVEWTGSPTPAQAAFVLCREEQLAELDRVLLPKFVVTERLVETPPARADVLAWITAERSH